jgi:hypothetical protein
MSERIDLQDAISARLSQAKGVCAIGRLAYERDTAIVNAMWGVESMLSEVQSLVNKLAELPSESAQAGSVSHG